MTQGNAWAVLVPAGMFGANEFDTDLDTGLRKLAAAVGEPSDRPDKYGADFENFTFLMHTYCWCEKAGCPWCSGCTCPESAWHYYIDGQEVSDADWQWFYTSRAPATSDPQWDEVTTAINARRETRHDPECPFCLGQQHAGRGAIAGRTAPNFWHKRTGLRVWWYKYIGRDVEVYNPNNADIGAVLAECFGSLGKTEEVDNG